MKLWTNRDFNRSRLNALFIWQITAADPGFGVWGGGDEIRQGDLRVLLLLSHMFMERMMQEN